MLPGIDRTRLDQAVSAALGRPIRTIKATALGESSRATPWRVDIDSGGDALALLVRYGESVSSNEVTALKAMADHPIPTPLILLWDESGDAVGEPLFVSEFIDGEPLLPAMVAGEEWAIDLYIDAACALQDITEADLPEGMAQQLGARDSATDVIETAYRRLARPEPLHEAAYRRLMETLPEIPEPAFSNGDLWPENILVRGKNLVGVIDWQHAGWTDPLFEFLLPFFLVPDLRNRGIEERFCERKGFDTSLLHWYHGVEFFDSLSIVLKIGRPYEMHTADTLTRDLEAWLRST
jgi:aminoglycoside phosphotransferase (APT) family kinase protein